MVPALGAEPWSQAVATAERVFQRVGVEQRDGEARVWTAAPARRRSQVRLVATGATEGVRVEVAHLRPEPRPWVAAAAWLFVPAAAVVGAVLSGRAAGPAEWAIVASLLAAPLLMAVGVGVAEWTQSLLALRRVRRVLGATEQAARRAQWPEAHKTDPDDRADDGLLTLPSTGLEPSRWLGSDEIEGLIEACPALVPPDALRRARRTVERRTAERGVADAVAPPLPDGSAEWSPATAPWTR